MKLVIDTNEIIAALLKAGVTRRILFDRRLSFLTPEYSLEELERHIGELSSRSGISEEELRLSANIIFEKIEIVPSSEYVDKIPEADRVMGSIDKGDVPFIALALAVPNDGVWSHDPHFQKQKAVRVWSTKDLMRYLSEADSTL